MLYVPWHQIVLRSCLLLAVSPATISVVEVTPGAESRQSKSSYSCVSNFAILTDVFQKRQK